MRRVPVVSPTCRTFVFVRSTYLSRDCLVRVACRDIPWFVLASSSDLTVQVQLAPDVTPHRTGLSVHVQPRVEPPRLVPYYANISYSEGAGLSACNLS